MYHSKGHTYVFEGLTNKDAPPEEEIYIEFEDEPPQKLLDQLQEVLQKHFVHLFFSYEEI